MLHTISAHIFLDQNSAVVGTVGDNHPTLRAISAQAINIGITLLIVLLVWLLIQFCINLFVKSVRKGVSQVSHTTSPVAQRMGRFLKGKRSIRRTEAMASLLRNSTTIILVIITVIIILKILNFDLGPILASVSILSLIIGFGAQQIIKDFIAGIFILIEDQFGIGDEIDVDDVTGIVTSMKMRVTTLVDDDDVIWYFRNGEMTKVGNYSKGRELTSKNGVGPRGTLHPSTLPTEPMAKIRKNHNNSDTHFPRDKKNDGFKNDDNDIGSNTE